MMWAFVRWAMEFQSTHPLRGATARYAASQRRHYISIHAPLAGCDGFIPGKVCSIPDFNPRTPCGVRHEDKAGFDALIGISIHAPLAGCDHLNRRHNAVRVISIHAPLAGCDKYFNRRMELEIISIHAPLAGCDLLDMFASLRPIHFNPRTPCGVRLCQICLFSSFRAISIHAPLAGCDCMMVFMSVCVFYFNPRTPCGVRLLTSKAA